MGRGLEQLRPLDQRFAHEAELEVLEIAQAAMDQLGGGRGRGAGIVALLGQHYFQPASGRVASDRRAMDAAANDEQVEGLGGQLSLPAMGRAGAKRPAESRARSVRHEAHPAPARVPASPYQVANNAKQDHAERGPNRKALPSRHGDVARLGLLEIEGVLAGQARTGFIGLLGHGRHFKADRDERESGQATPARSRSWMWMMPTGRPPSTTNSVVMADALIISSAALARRSGDTVLGAGVMISWVRRASRPSPM